MSQKKARSSNHAVSSDVPAVAVTAPPPPPAPLPSFSPSLAWLETQSLVTQAGISLKLGDNDMIQAKAQEVTEQLSRLIPSICYSPGLFSAWVVESGLSGPCGSPERVQNPDILPTKLSFVRGLEISLPWKTELILLSYIVSRTRKLITQIAQVCQELRAMVPNRSIKNTRLTTPSRLGTDHRNTEPLSSKYGKDGRGYTHSTDNKKHVRCEDQHNSPDTRTRHERPSLPSPPPPTSPSPTSSHSSAEVSASELSASSDEPPSCLMVGNVGETMELSSSQNETKDSGVDLDSRGGGLPCPDETSEWRSRNRAGTGDCRKSPRMGHWQADEGTVL